MAKSTDPAKDTQKAQKSIQSAFQRAAVTNTSLPSGMDSYTDTGHQSFFKQAIQNPLSNIVRTGGEILNRPSQLVLQSAQKALGNAPTEQSWGKILSHLGDIKGMHDINTREELGLDKNVGGRPAGLLDTVATIVQDPLTYASFGTSAVARVGLKAAESSLGRQAATRLATKGIKGLSEAEQKTLRASIISNSSAKDTEAFADKVLSKVAQPQGIKLAGKTVVPKSLTLPITETVAKTPIGTVGKKLSDTFVPRARLTKAAGPITSANARQAEVRGEIAATGHQQQLQNELRSAVKPGQINGEDLHNISLALQTGKAATQREVFQQTGNEAAARLTETLEKSRRRNIDALQRAGYSPEAVNKVNTGRVLTPEAEKWVAQHPHEAQTLGLHTPQQSGFLHARTHDAGALDPNSTVQDLNERLRAKTGFNVFETNPIAIAQSNAEHASNLIRDSHTIQELKSLQDGKGNPLLVIGEAKPHGLKDYVPISLGDLGHGWVPGPLQQHFMELKDALSSQGVNGFQQFLNKWTTLWKSYATVPVLFGLGFHERNLVGNLWNMYVRGFSDPRSLVSASKAVQTIISGERKGLTATDAVAKSGLSDFDKEAIQAAIKEGTINESFFRSELAKSSEILASKKAAFKNLANPLSTENAVIRPGRALGRTIEDSNRLAMFMSEYAKHGDSKLAAQVVKETLFDYGDLTKADRAIKQFVPFWTWTSRNLPAQIKGLMEHPGRMEQPFHLQQNLEAGAPDTDGKPLPNYAVMGNQIPLVGGKNPILGTVALPSGAALQSIQPILQALTELPGGPKSLRPEQGGQDIAQSLMSLIGGGPLGAVKAGTEAATGTNAFTGAPLSTQGGIAGNTARNLVPTLGKGLSLQKKTSSPDTRTAALISSLTGATTTPVTEKSVKSESVRRSLSVNQKLKAAKVPTKKALGLRRAKATTKVKPKSKVSKAFQAPKMKKPKTSQ